MSLTRSKYVLLLTAALIFALFPLTSRADNKLVQTPQDYEGPFYPLVRQPDEDNDLLHVAGRVQAARGDTLYLSGRVVDEDGLPFNKATVEIWQTDQHGRYKDQRDKSPGPRDPDFQYWGRAITRPDGGFSFTTLVPGAYQPRPAHIHFKVWIDGRVRLTSQIYFRGTNKQKAAEEAQPETPDLQTVDLRSTKTGDYEAFFQIVLSRLQSER